MSPNASTLREVLFVEPRLRELHGTTGLRRLKAPYLRYRAIEQMVVLSFLLQQGVSTPANDLHKRGEIWFY